MMRVPGQTTMTAIGLVALRLTNPDRPLPFEVCLFKGMTGWPCPTCGLTRAVCHALRGEWAASLAYNPAGLLVAAGLVAWTIWSAAEAVQGRPLAEGVRDRVRVSFVAVCAAISAVNWAAGFVLGRTVPL